MPSKIMTTSQSIEVQAPSRISWVANQLRLGLLVPGFDFRCSHLASKSVVKNAMDSLRLSSQFFDFFINMLQRWIGEKVITQRCDAWLLYRYSICPGWNMRNPGISKLEGRHDFRDAGLERLSKTSPESTVSSTINKNPKG